MNEEEEQQKIQKLQNALSMGEKVWAVWKAEVFYSVSGPCMVHGYSIGYNDPSSPLSVALKLTELSQRDDPYWVYPIDQVHTSRDEAEREKNTRNNEIFQSQFKYYTLYHATKDEVRKFASDWLAERNYEGKWQREQFLEEFLDAYVRLEKLGECAAHVGNHLTSQMREPSFVQKIMPVQAYVDQPCPICDGTGEIELLTSVSPCECQREG